MKIVVPREIKPHDKRVSLMPDSVKNLLKSGFEVFVEKGAGEGAYYSDSDYETAGAKIEARTDALFQNANIIVKIHAPVFHDALKRHEIELMPQGVALISLLYPLTNLDTIKMLREKQITAFALDLVPRTTLAQSMDVLSSMSTVSGYKAVLIAATHLPKFFPMFMTAAGTVSPAKVFVIGAGVAGLQACATARRLGAVVEALDQRLKVREEVESIGARFVEVPTDEEAQTKEGYARELSEAYKKRQAEILQKHIAKSDVVITTALIPGKRAPIIITEEMVREMKPGSVIVDLAADFGGNCELTEPGREVIKHGVIISGMTNIPGSMPFHASQMFSRNVERFIMHIASKDGLKMDMKDDIIKGTLITHKGEIVHEGVKRTIGG